MGMHSFQGKRPQVDATAFVAAGAQVIGDVRIGPGASVWFNAVLRGDVNYIELGAGSNVQDSAVVHCDSGSLQTVIGANVTIGHGAIVHGCRIGSNTLIGMGAILLNGVKVAENSIVAAGALLPEGKEYPPGSMIMGVPGRVVRQLAEHEIAAIGANVATYQRLCQDYRSEGTASLVRQETA